ncbi:MAG TPA: MlaD family protein [Steroidobacteraceae bacterium]|nr:MlaD family protein [Steroidobacteraceae bacterium]
MEREANYTTVGAFVLLVTAMSVLFVYWYSGAGARHHYTRYEVYFDGSVSGLTPGAAVRYLGVSVGRVVSMRIDPRNAGRVQVIVDLDSSTPISDRTVAQLSEQGVTGVLFIDLLRNAGSKPLVEAVAGENYPVIRSAQSNIDVLLASLPSMVGHATQALERVEALLSPSNVSHVSQTLAGIDRASAELPQTVHDLNVALADLHATSAEFRGAARSVRELTDSVGPQLRAAAENVASATAGLSKAAAGMQQMIGENRADVRGFTRDALPQLQRLIGDSRAAAVELHDLARSLKEDPSQLLYQPQQQGVSIPP